MRRRKEGFWEQLQAVQVNVPFTRDLTLLIDLGRSREGIVFISGAEGYSGAGRACGGEGDKFKGRRGNSEVCVLLLLMEYTHECITI